MPNLTAMRYKDYVWPHNPRVYTIDFTRRLAADKVPFGHYVLQDLGPAWRVMRGAGEFAGAGAYEEFKRLASVFYSAGPGVLVHPVWQSSSAYFTALSLAQEPRADYVRYSFEFREGYGGYRTGLTQAEGPAAPAGAGVGGPLYHTVARGETLWAIARAYGVALEEVLRLNPGLKNPNLIHPGEEVRVR